MTFQHLLGVISLQTVIVDAVTFRWFSSQTLPSRVRLLDKHFSCLVANDCQVPIIHNFSRGSTTRSPFPQMLMHWSAIGVRMVMELG